MINCFAEASVVRLKDSGSPMTFQVFEKKWAICTGNVRAIAMNRLVIESYNVCNTGNGRRILFTAVLCMSSKPT